MTKEEKKLLDKLSLLEKATFEHIRHLEKDKLTDDTVDTISVCGAILRSINKVRKAYKE